MKIELSGLFKLLGRLIQKLSAHATVLERRLIKGLGKKLKKNSLKFKQEPP